MVSGTCDTNYGDMLPRHAPPGLGKIPEILLLQGLQRFVEAFIHTFDNDIIVIYIMFERLTLSPYDVFTSRS